ncbi:MAG: hypothetical protein AB8B87_26835 [Granulosicoccus sp.]
MKFNQTGKRSTIHDLPQLANKSASIVGSVLKDTWEKRCISKKLAGIILTLENEMGYSTNLQALDLRSECSVIVGKIVPMYDNCYFTCIEQTLRKLFISSRDRWGYFRLSPALVTITSWN